MEPVAVTFFKPTWEALDTVNALIGVFPPMSAPHVTVEVPAARVREFPLLTVADEPKVIVLSAEVPSVFIESAPFKVTAYWIETAPAVPPEVVSITLGPEMVIPLLEDPRVTVSADVFMVPYMVVTLAIEVSPPLKVKVSPLSPRVTPPVFEKVTALVMVPPPFRARL